MSKTTQKRHKIIRKTTASPTKCLRNGGFTYGAGEGNRTYLKESIQQGSFFFVCIFV